MNEQQETPKMPRSDTPLNPEQRQALYEAACTEGGGLYKQIVTIATIVLGASLFVIEKLRPASGSITFYLMAFGGIFLLVSLALTLMIRFWNVKSMALMAQGHRAKAQSHDKCNSCLTWIVIGCVTAGILLMGLSVIVAASSRNCDCALAARHGKGETAMGEDKKSTPPPDKKIITEKAIPTSAFFPDQEVEAPTPPEQPQPDEATTPSQENQGSEGGDTSEGSPSE